MVFSPLIKRFHLLLLWKVFRWFQTVIFFYLKDMFNDIDKELKPAKSVSEEKDKVDKDGWGKMVKNS